MKPIKRISANWVAIVPFAFMNSDSPEISHNNSKNWWGSKPSGIANTVKYAKYHNLQTFLKPHFWVDNKGWAGELDFDSKNWLKWEGNYSKYMLELAALADSLNIDMLCVGVELKSSVQTRPEFWLQLIPKIKAVYKGKVTYAANWDNYENVPFWHLLDYIGVDAYFPLSNHSNPSEEVLLKKWLSHADQLSQYSSKNKKQILFTEMGYRSTNNGAGNQWEIESRLDTVQVNLKLQSSAYVALFQACWNRPWFAGSFIWEWHALDKTAGGLMHSNYTPQNKPTEKIIGKWYGSSY